MLCNHIQYILENSYYFRYMSVNNHPTTLKLKSRFWLPQLDVDILGNASATSFASIHDVPPSKGMGKDVT
jgi:hypothetical protein